MELVKLSALCVACLVPVLLLRRKTPEQALLLTIAILAVAAARCVSLALPLMEELRALFDRAGIEPLYLSILLRTLAGALAPVTSCVGFPSELVPLVTVKMFSSSAATSLLLDVYKQFGPDSSLGTLASVLMSCSETIFYTMSVYFMTARVTRTRYTLAGALFATLAGIIASVLLV